jgi:SAM-dependent methyltransferase
MDEQILKKEASFFSATHNALTRQVAWSSIPYFQKRIDEAFDMLVSIQQHFSGRRNLKALTLACGDMSGEYHFFSRVGVSHIIAYDVSSGQRDKFYIKYDGRIPVDYHIADVNQLELPRNTFDIVYMNQSLHHIEAVEQVVSRLATALTPDGLFALNDYIGVPFLQRSHKQRELTARLWPHLPERLRRNHKGNVFNTPHIPKKDELSPYEAIRSDAILPALHANFIPLKELTFGGFLFPLINGFAQNYTEDDDATLLKMLWEMDQYMIEQGAIEPNFIRAVYVPRGRHVQRETAIR